MAKTKKKAAKKPTTALAVRKPAVRPPQVVLSGFPAQIPIGQLGELATVGALGLAEIKLTDAEEAVLAEKVNPADILVRDGGIAYLPHITYTRWFSRAFGRTGWAIVPTAQPKKVGNLVLVPYLLYVHGVPVAAATGEHEYHEINARQTYGDVIESTVASALRRCAKRLAVGLEMWDKAWLLANANAKGAKAQARPEWVEAEPTSSQPESAEVITLPQRGRLAKIAEKAGRKPAEVSLWLKQRWGVASSKAIKRSDYAEIVRQLEARGALSLPGDGGE